MNRDPGMDAFNKYCQQKVIGFFKLLWSGTYKAARKSKEIAWLYACLGIATLFAGLIFQKWGFMLLVAFCVALAIGISEYVKDGPIRKKRQFFSDVFITMNFKASDSLYPHFIDEAELSEYTTAFSFDTLIPLNKWLSRKEELEMYFGEKIVDIRQDKGDNRIIHVLVGVNPLPDYVEWNEDYLARDNVLGIGIGYAGNIGMNLEIYPHAFIAGETGSGKSNILKCMIYQALIKEYDVILIDFKRGVSFSAFNDKVAIYYDYPEVVQVLKDMVSETSSRLDKFRNRSVDNIADYNRISGESLRRKIIFIDELAELLKTRDKETANALHDSIETLTRLSRATGIHLIMGIQRPDSTIINGQIKNNVSYRVCGRFVDREPSRIMLSSDAASLLSNIKGRFIIKDDDLYEVQSFYFLGGNIPVNMSAVRPPVQQSPELGAAAIAKTTQSAQSAQATQFIEDSKSTFADLFFKTRKEFNQSDNGDEMCAIMTISGQINRLLTSYQRDEIRFHNPRELGLALLEVLLKESGINSSECMVEHIQMTLQQLLDDGNEPAYSRQSQFVVETKLKSGELEQTPLLLMIALVTEFICRSVGLGGDGSYSEKLYKLFNYEGKEQLTESLFTMWAALAVATEFDEDLWSDYRIKLFEMKSDYIGKHKQVSKVRNEPVEVRPIANTDVSISKENPIETPAESKPFDFDFSGLGK